MRHTTVGLLEFSPERSFKGITIVTPLHGKTTYLIGMLGEVLHQWDHPAKPGNYAYLLPGGNLLWAGETEKGPKPGGGKGGLLREYDWEGNVLWEYRDDHQHHDFRRLQNGNTIYIGWEKMPQELQSRMIGAEAGSEDKGGVTWSDYVKEIDPKGKTVWEWHAHTDLEIEEYPLHIMSTRKEFLHCNTCAELPDGNIMLSFRKNSTVVVIDKVTKKVIKKWQNDSWGQQHDSQRLENGNVLIFANGIHVAGPGVFGSKVIEFDWDTGDEVWTYQGSPRWTMFSPNISGAQRQPNGNTLICEGLNGRLLEVTQKGKIVWEYISPWFIQTQDGPNNSVFRAYRYSLDSPEIDNRLQLNF